jgi:hypothetical protein
MVQGQRQGRVAICLLLACGSAPPAEHVGTRVGPAINAALGAFDEARAPIQCLGSGTLVDETLALSRSWKLSGTTATATGAGPFTIGLIADAGGAAAATLAALGRLQAQLGDADLIVALGGMGATQAELEATLGTLADRAKGPVIAIAGDLEPAPALTRAIAALRARKKVVVDGRLARTIELPGATLATLPGSRSPARLVAGPDGCGYTTETISARFAELTSRPGLRILASAEAPRTTVDGEATGELAVTPGALQEIDLIVHGPTTEAPSPASTGTRDGSAVALTPGTSDATTRLPDPARKPSAGLLTIDGTAWRWRPLVDKP